MAVRDFFAGGFSLGGFCHGLCGRTLAFLEDAFQRVHEIDHLGWLLGAVARWRLAMVALGIDQLLERFTVMVVVTGKIVSAAVFVNQALGEGEIFALRL